MASNQRDRELSPHKRKKCSRMDPGTLVGQLLCPHHVTAGYLDARHADEATILLGGLPVGVLMNAFRVRRLRPFIQNSGTNVYPCDGKVRDLILKRLNKKKKEKKRRIFYSVNLHFRKCICSRHGKVH
ncbi:hypothetical protein CEXT_412811 [Caerostris extrusa]|uniref:Uncharacterized protein n=1 Tax=Caerostris extrusa TaxID=172846 RepID=A0AAV4XQ46_CAEEX|nr:hypothetical protein CEXT_412811 [Caerostris extrusa]